MNPLDRGLGENYRKEQAMTEVKSGRVVTEEAREMLLEHMKLLHEYEQKHGATPAGLQAMTGAAALLDVSC